MFARRSAWLLAITLLACAAQPARAAYCSFTGAACVNDGDCSLLGVCYVGAEGPVCHQKCATNADCTAATFCFQNGEIGGICVGCAGDNSKCTAYAVCDLNDCKEFGHAECVQTGDPCVFADQCVGGETTTTTVLSSTTTSIPVTTTTVPTTTTSLVHFTTTTGAATTTTETFATVTTTTSLPTARRTRKRCRVACEAAIADCATHSHRRRSCRHQMIRRCRQYGFDACVVTTTTTVFPESTTTTTRTTGTSPPTTTTTAPPFVGDWRAVLDPGTPMNDCSCPFGWACCSFSSPPDCCQQGINGCIVGSPGCSCGSLPFGQIVADVTIVAGARDAVTFDGGPTHFATFNDGTTLEVETDEGTLTLTRATPDYIQASLESHTIDQYNRSCVRSWFGQLLPQ